MMGIAAAMASEKSIEIFLGTVVAIIAFFSKRTLSSYDRRIENLEKDQEHASDLLHKIDKDVTKLTTMVEMMMDKK